MVYLNYIVPTQYALLSNIVAANTKLELHVRFWNKAVPLNIAMVGSSLHYDGQIGSTLIQMTRRPYYGNKN